MNSRYRQEICTSLRELVAGSIGVYLRNGDYIEGWFDRQTLGGREDPIISIIPPEVRVSYRDNDGCRTCQAVPRFCPTDDITRIVKLYTKPEQVLFARE